MAGEKMTPQPAQSYAERSRYARRVELAKLARDHHVNVSFVIGASLRLGGRQIHVDWTSGINPYAGPRKVVSWGKRTASWVLARLWPWRAKRAVEVPGRPKPLGWRDALAQAAPVDAQRPVPDGRGRRDPTAAFARINTAAIAQLAQNLMQERRRPRSPARSTGPAPRLSLPRIGDPFFGGGHVFYVVRFGDDGGEAWIMKIPAAGEDGGWDALCRETLRAETFLLHTLRTATDVPVPEVIDADCNAENEVGAPWLLMEFVEGRRLEDVWFGCDAAGTMDAGVLRGRREKILRNVADAMAQLGRYRFDRGGALRFGKKDGDLVGTGPLRLLDVQAMVDRWLVDEDCETRPVYRAAGPWDDEADMYTALLDAYPPANVPGRGVDELLRLLLSLVCEPAARWSRSSLLRLPGRIDGARRMSKRESGKKFVLAHPDLSMRHILLAEDGTTIKAILGWDGAWAAPRSLGNEALPRWLVRDFDPFTWGWRPPADLWRGDHAQPECNRFEDPPWVLRELRGYYARVMQELKTDESERDERKGRRLETSLKEGSAHDEKHESRDIDITKQSLLTLTLDKAIRDPRCRAAALRRVIEKCSRPFEELDFDSFVSTLGEGYEIDPSKLKRLAHNIGELVDNGFVKGAVVW